MNHGSATSAQADAACARDSCSAIFLGGAAGGLARAALEQAWPADGHGWPWVTFAVNIAGTALLALRDHAPRRPTVVPRPAARHRPVRRADDVLDAAARGARARARRSRARSGRPTPRQHRRRAARRRRRERALRAERARVTARRLDRRRRSSAAPARCLRFLLAHGRGSAGGGPVPARHPGRQRASARSLLGVLHGAGVTGDALLLAGHGAARLVHDVLDLDGRERAPGRGGRARPRRSPTSPGASRSAWPPSRSAGPLGAAL